MDNAWPREKCRSPIKTIEGRISEAKYIDFISRESSAEGPVVLYVMNIRGTVWHGHACEIIRHTRHQRRQTKSNHHANRTMGLKLNALLDARHENRGGFLLTFYLERMWCDGLLQTAKDVFPLAQRNNGWEFFETKTGENEMRKRWRWTGAQRCRRTNIVLQLFWNHKARRVIKILSTRE